MEQNEILKRNQERREEELKKQILAELNLTIQSRLQENFVALQGTFNSTIILV